VRRKHTPRRSDIPTRLSGSERHLKGVEARGPKPYHAYREDFEYYEDRALGLLAIEALLEGGADPTVRDALYGSAPAGWAEHSQRHAAAKLLQIRGG
jgi:hypothetical protein